MKTDARPDRVPRSIASAMLLALSGLAWASPLWVCGPAGAAPGALAAAQPPGARQGRPPDAVAELPLSPAVRKLIDRPFLKASEQRALRLRHGVPEAGDLESPRARAAQAALRGAWRDASLDAPEASPLDRAEAMLERGEPGAALEVLLAAQAAGAEPMRAARLAATAFERAGQWARAAQAAQPALDALLKPPSKPEQGPGSDLTPGEVAEAVRAAAVLLRARGAGAPEGDFEALMAILGQARRRDPMEHRVALAEAELLTDKDSLAQAESALREAIGLNQGCARAWAMVGQMAVGALDITAAEQIADRLDSLSRLDEVEGAAPPPASPLAAELRARAYLRLNDPERAAAALERARPAFPRRTELLAQSAAVTALGYDWPALDAALAQFDTQAALPGAQPGELPPLALLSAGKALAEARQYAKGAQLLAAARARAPHWAQPAIELGLLEMQAGRDEQALDALTAARALDPFNVRADNSLKLLRELLKHVRVEARNPDGTPAGAGGGRFVVRAREGVDAMLAAEMLPVLASIHEQVTGNAPGALAHDPPSATLIDLCANHERFAVRIAGLPQIHTIAASTGPVIAMEAPREGPGHTGTYDWERVIRHEYAHTVGLSRTGNRIPHWFTEAQAVNLELAPRDYRTCQLLARVLLRGRLFDFTKINLAFSRPEKPTDRAQAYAQGHWMLQFMLERFGPDSHLKLMDLYAQGVREEAAFQRVLGVGRDEFLAQFKPWARAQVVSWGLLPPEGQPALSDLIGSPAAEADAGADDPPAGSAPAAPRELTPQRVDELLAQHPQHPDLLELAVQAALRANNGEPTPAMAELLRRYAAARPVDPMPHRHLARLALAQGEEGVGKAIDHLEFLDAREEKLSVYAAQLAELYAQAGQPALARQKAERATRVAPYEARHRELAAALAVQAGDYPEARRHIEFLVALEPDRPIHKQRLEALARREAEKAAPNAQPGRASPAPQ